jgi:hypothetical protein
MIWALACMGLSTIDNAIPVRGWIGARIQEWGRMNRKDSAPFGAVAGAGDLISFSGLCLVSGRWTTIVNPSIMLAGFVFANIPMLDSHLHDHYGAAFDSVRRMRG